MTQIPLFSFMYQITQTWLLYIFLNIVASLVATLNLSAQFLLLELFFFSFFCQELGIMQCFVFLGFLSLFENFGLATPIPVGIRVVGVKTPLRT